MISGSVRNALLVLLVAACGGDDLVLPEEGVPAAIAAVSGNDQTGTVGVALAESLVARVTDAAGRAVTGQRVDFTLAAGGGSVSPTTATTDGNGLVATSWTLGPGAGAQLVTAKPIGNGTPANLQVVFTAGAGASNATTLALVSGDNQTATAGTALPDSLVVRVLDANGNPVAGVTVTWATSGGGTVSAASIVTGSNGRAAVRRTLGATAGTQTTTASSAGLTGSPITFTSNATVGAAGRLTIARQPSTTASSAQPFATQPQVQLQDANGNPVNTASIAVTAQIASGPAGSSLSGTSTVATNASGLATFGNLGITGPAGDYTLNFVVLGRTDISGTPPTNTITLTAGSAARLTFQVQPTSTAAGATITPAVRVRVEDALGNLVTSASNSITVALGSNPGAGTLSGTRTVSASAGVATFSTLSIDRSGNGYTLVASASGLTGTTSNPFNISTGAATAIAANSATTLSAVAGSAVSPAPSVKVTDNSGNPVAGVSVTFAVTAGGGSVSGATQTTNAQGIATVGSWILGTTAGSSNNQLRATSTGLSGSPVTFTASATAGSAGSLTFVTQPATTGQSGVSLNPQPVLQLVDGNGNPVASGGVAITATIATGPGGSLSGASVNTSAQGVATFSSLTITGPSGTYSLAFSGTNLTGVTSGNIVIGSGAATKLGITTPPSTNVINGQDFPQQPVIQLQDGSGNAVGTAGVTVTAAVQSCSGKTLSGDVSVQTNSGGQAVFTDLRLTGTAGSCTLLFAASGLTSVSSGIITVAPGPVSAAQSTLTASPGTITAGGAGSTITVTARDASNNVISGANVIPSISGGTGDFTPNSDVTNGSGVATFALTSTDAGTRTIGASVGGVTIAATATVTVNAAAASASASTLSVTPSTITAGGAGASATVTARDQYGNPVSGATAAVDVTGSNNTVTPPSGSTSASGVFTATITSTETGVKTVSATVNGAALPGTVQLTVNPGAPSTSTSSVTVNPTSETVGNAVTVTVTTLDASGNAAGGTVSLTSSQAGAFADATPTPNGSGVATTTFTPAAIGSHTITATLTNAAGSVQETTTLTVTAPAVSASASSLSLSPGSITAGGSGSSASVTARDASSNPVAGASVTLAVTGSGNSIAPSMTVVADGSGVAAFTVTSTGAGGKTVSAAANGTAVTQTQSLTVSAASANAGNSSLALTPASVASGGSTTVDATFQDGFGNPIAGQSISLGTDASGAFGDMTPTTNGSGAASTTYTPSSTGTHTISATLGAVTKQADLTVTAGAVSASASGLAVGPPTTVTAGNNSGVLVIARDAASNLISGATVVLGVTGSGVSITTNPAVTDGSGEASFAVTVTQSGTKTVTAAIDGLTITQTGELIITPAAASASTSSLALGSGTTTAGSGVTVTATVLDQFSNPIPGASVTFATTGAGSFGANPVATDGAGQASSVFTPTSAELHSLSASVGTELASETLDVSAGLPDAGASGVTAESPRSPGVPSTVTVTVRDQFSNLVAGVTVTLAEQGGDGVIGQPAAVTDGAGQTTGSFTGVLPQSYTIRATAGAVLITQAATVQVL